MKAAMRSPQLFALERTRVPAGECMFCPFFLGKNDELVFGSDEVWADAYEHGCQRKMFPPLSPAPQLFLSLYTSLHTWSYQEAGNKRFVLS